MMPLSQNDRRILALLRDNARRTVSDIAATIGLSRQTVSERIDKLYSNGVIKRFTIETDDALDLDSASMRAMFDLRLKRNCCRNIYLSVQNWPELVACWTLSGELDMRILVAAISNSEVERLRDRLARHTDVERVHTVLVLKTWADRRSADIALDAPEHLCATPQEG